MSSFSAIPPGLPRRLVAMAYDALLLVGLWMVAGLLFVQLAARQDFLAPGGTRLLFQGYLLFVCFLFNGWFWVRGGQTLGMRAWRLRLVRADGGPITSRIAAIRFGAALLALAPLGLGYWWALFDKDKRAWHDRLSGTHLIVTPKPIYYLSLPPRRQERQGESL